MNSSLEALAWGHDDSKTLPERRFRRRVGLRAPLPGIGSRRCSPAHPRAARGVQRAALGGAHRLPLALHAPRLATLGGPLPADPKVAQSGGVFEAMVHDLLRALLRLTGGRAPEPTAAIFDSRTLRSTPESGARGGYDGAKRKKGSKVHAAVDTLGHLLALLVTPADEQDREQIGELAEAVREATGETVELAYVDQGYSGERADGEAQAQASGWR